MTTSLNIVELIENNPITKLSDTYQHRLLNKIKSSFTDNEQQLFLASFYCYLNHDQRHDFVIDLDNVWKWLEFSTKQKAKLLLESQFTIDVDYKILLNLQVNQTTHIRGGHNKETFMLNIRTFKLFCLKAGTKKAEQTHEYYIKLEELLQDILNEETNELRLQLQTHAIDSQKEKEALREKTILEQFTNNTQCVYYGIIDNKSPSNESLIKFGNSNFLRDRVECHKKVFNNFRLVNAFKVDNKLQIENAIKKHPLLTTMRRTVKINNVNQTELLICDNLSFDDLDKIIKDIITTIEYSPENYSKLLEDNLRLKKENLYLINKYVKKSSAAINDDISFTNTDYVSLDLKKTIKHPDGLYHVNNKSYSLLEGTRQQVWDEIAYKTSGLLTKDDLVVNKLGKIVSKKKFNSAKLDNRLNKHK